MPKAPPIGSLGGENKFDSLVEKTHPYYAQFKTIFDSEVEELPSSTIHFRLWLIFKGKGFQCQDCLTTLKS